jgi:hypothetical protein
LSKTHNRCSDAIWRHCLVLASPDGPYRELDGAVYRDVDELCNELVALDHTAIAARLRRTTAEISRTYSKSQHAERLARFINDTKARPDAGKESVRPSGPRVLILGSNAKSVGFARTLDYLTACFEGWYPKEKVDFRFKCGSPANGKVAIRMSYAGKPAVLEALLSRGKSIDVRVEKPGGDLSLSVTLPLPKPLLEAAQCAEGIVDAHGDLREYIHEIHTEIIITALRDLGFSNFDLCTESAGGWESYARLAAPRLWQACLDLRPTWQQKQDSEHGIGRRPPSSTTEREVVNA